MSYVQVPVPEHLVPAVYRLIADHEGDHSATGGEEVSNSGVGASWSREELDRMYRESPRKSVQVVLRELATRPGEEVRMRDLLEPVHKASGKKTTRRTLAGAFGAYGRRVKNRYKKTWPFEAKWNHEHGEMGYTMPEDVAKVIRKAAGIE